MAKSLSNQDSASRDDHYLEDLTNYPEPEIPAGKVYYFDNAKVEQLLYNYVEGACTDVELRDDIMQHASELIRQIIRANNLQSIYPGRDEASFGDLFQVAWCQIESTLYKYEALPYCLSCYNRQRPQDSQLCDQMLFYADLIKIVKRCPNCGAKITRSNVYYKGKSKVFNLWSQVSRTVVLAYIKKESRDRKNYGNYQTHLLKTGRPRSYMADRFLDELRSTFKHNDEYLEIINAIGRLYDKDDRLNEGFMSKLISESGKSRSQVSSFLKFVRLRSLEFTDSPTNLVDEKLEQNPKVFRNDDD